MMSFGIRKNVRNLLGDELRNLRTAYRQMMQLGDNRGFNYLAELTWGTELELLASSA